MGIHQILVRGLKVYFFYVIDLRGNQLHSGFKNKSKTNEGTKEPIWQTAPSERFNVDVGNFWDWKKHRGILYSSLWSSDDCCVTSRLEVRRWFLLWPLTPDPSFTKKEGIRQSYKQIEGESTLVLFICDSVILNNPLLTSQTQFWRTINRVTVERELVQYIWQTRSQDVDMLLLLV